MLLLMTINYIYMPIAYAINVNTKDIHGSTPSVNDFKERIKSLLRNCILDCLDYEK